MDQDYAHNLSQDDKVWLSKFYMEYYNANFNYTENNLITDPEEQREVYRDNNRRNNDVFSKNKSRGTLTYDPDNNVLDQGGVKSYQEKKNEIEDELILKIELTRLSKKILKDGGE